MSSAKKIGLFACTGVVAGNMMGSGIALLPANLASIGGIAIWGWVIFNYWCDVSGLCLCPTGH
ncbi:Lysine/cadaverine antiporter membrane protein CadB [Klebsiella pneumoniae]|nr:Lysine/cadaverine antiporter membrane protein CadB [Klebsiella pneumoniae]